MQPANNAARYDRQSGQSISIKPYPGENELTYRWNWDTPILISPHNNKRIYIAASFLFRSEDQGSHRDRISPDLTRNENRDNFRIMDKYWPADAVAKNRSTSLWGTIVSLTESKAQKDLLYTGSDDGMISVSENGGANWRMIKTFPGVPEYTYVSDILADRFNADIVNATFNNHKRDDFKPYVMKSTDKGKTRTAISANLPVNGPEPFICKPLDIVTMPVTDGAARERWIKEVSEFSRVAYGAISYASGLDEIRAPWTSGRVPKL